MTLEYLDNLVKIRKLNQEPADQTQIDGLIGLAHERLSDICSVREHYPVFLVTFNNRDNVIAMLLQVADPFIQVVGLASTKGCFAR